MSDAFGNVPEYSVSDLSRALKRSVEEQFGYVRVRAELSGVKRAASGHLYLALKDQDAVMDGVMWRGQAARLGFVPEDGLEVICTGQLTTYPARSKYQMKIDSMEPAGAGALMAVLEARKKALAAEGLFASDRKKSLPFIPRRIGVVTSPTGAVIRDILHRLADRFPSEVVLWPVKVQGEGAAEDIAAAIRGFNAMDVDSPYRPDLLIVARGGGSIEDLWAFNEESVVRAAADSDIVLISAVGHETDTTLIDYAADQRAPTPTGAAEMAVPVRADLQAQLSDLDRRQALLSDRIIADRRRQVLALARALPRPADLMGLAAQRLDDLGDRLPRALQALAAGQKSRLDRSAALLSPRRLQQRTEDLGLRLRSLAGRMAPAAMRGLSDRAQALSASARLLSSLGYENTLARGYVVAFDASGAVIKDQAGLADGTAVQLKFRDGLRDAVLGYPDLDGFAGEDRATLKQPKAAALSKTRQKTQLQKTGPQKTGPQETGPRPNRSRQTRRMVQSPDIDDQGSLF